MTKSMRIALAIAGVLVLVALVSYATQWEDMVALWKPRPYQRPRTQTRGQAPGQQKTQEVLGQKQAPVKVWALVMPSQCWQDARVLLRKMSKQYPQQLYVEIWDMSDEKGRAAAEAKGKSCACIEINGASEVKVTMPDGTQRSVLLDKSPGHGYSMADLQMALEQTLKKAGANVVPAKPAASGEKKKSATA